ncbi:ABC transporter ATP-binding protein [Anaerostipes sp.]|uniref:ABC transporter ATP-binding protein n=1 Tax=Anaerostipes sp. TaxID=1872530 RepID=UPI0025B86F4C|nr:ABC transporter ATP-binding protein [Anaerostipes sp.]MBS7006912.1 ABC transporter ATP-binding protein [Anaerostipes sp.]
MNQDCITMEHVGIAFQDKKALSDVNITVSEGEIFGFLGPSGAGKTTTIKLLSAQLTQYTGQISVMGMEPVKDVSRLYQNIGILSDNSGFYEKMSVEENLKIFAEIYRLPKTRIPEVLEQLHLAGDEKKKAEKLSRGMKQRLLFARAILHKPKLLFLDEPTANLDPSTSEDVHNIIKDLNRNGTTVFLTTHDMEEADELCSRVAFLNEGSIKEIGVPEELKIKYAKDRVRILYGDGTVKEIPKNKERIASELSGTDKEIVTIHSVEPDLKTIFLDLTGRELA